MTIKPKIAKKYQARTPLYVVYWLNDNLIHLYFKVDRFWKITIFCYNSVIKKLGE